MPFDNALAAHWYLHSPNGKALTKLAHTYVMRAAKTDGTHDGWEFIIKKPSSSTGAPVVPPHSSSSATPALGLFLFVTVPCACCGAKICGIRYSCENCHKLVDDACMPRIASKVHCFVCTCRVCGQEVSAMDVKCHKCHFPVH